MVEVPVNEGGINLADFWQFKAYSVEGLYLLDKLSRSITDYNPKNPAYMVGASIDDQMPLYLLRRKEFSADTLSKTLGVSVAKLESSVGVIVLKSTPIDLPEPTVTYWGTS